MLEYPKSARLLRPPEFRQTYDEGVKISSPLFVCFARKTGNAEPSRFGFTCPRGLGKATVRNRIKRRLRECVRLKRQSFPLGLDIVFNPRKALLDAPWPEIERHVEKLLQRLDQQCAPSLSPP